MKPKPYPQYKDSGVGWLGDIPDHWTCSPGLSVLSKKKVKNTGMQESRVLSLSYGRIVIKPEEKLHGLVPESFETYQIVEPNDIIIRPTDLQNDYMSLRVGQVKDRGIITSAYLCLVSRPPITRDYCYSLLNTYDLIKVYYGMGSGLRQNLDFADFRRLPILIPSTDEQRQIVRFLDAKTRLIDRFIRNKGRLIELLQEQKQAVINDCVTGKMEVRRIVDENGNSSFRIQPYAEYKDSGVDWIGEIPKHWVTKRLKYLSNIKTGDKNTEDNMENGIYPFFVRSQIVKRLNTYSFDGEAVLTAGDGVGVGRVFHYFNGKFDYHQRVYAITHFKELIGKFIFYYLRANLVKEMLKYNVKSTVDSLRLPMFQNFAVAFPQDNREQKSIVEYIDCKTSKIDQLIENIDEQIKMLKEYRTRLIADVVTGKVDVRGIAVEDVPEDEMLEELVDEMDEGLLDDDEYEDEA